MSGTAGRAMSRKQVVEAAVRTVIWWLGRSAPDAFADVLAERARLVDAAAVRHHFAARDELVAEVRRTLLTRFARQAERAVAAEPTPAGRARALVDAAVNLLHRAFHEAHALHVLAVEVRVPGSSWDDVLPDEIAAFRQQIRRAQHTGDFAPYHPGRVAGVLTGLGDAARASSMAQPGRSNADAVGRALLELTPPPPGWSHR